MENLDSPKKIATDIEVAAYEIVVQEACKTFLRSSADKSGVRNALNMDRRAVAPPSLVKSDQSIEKADQVVNAMNTNNQTVRPLWVSCRTLPLNVAPNSTLCSVMGQLPGVYPIHLRR